MNAMRTFGVVGPILLLTGLAAFPASGGPSGANDAPVTVAISVSPSSVSSGADTSVTVKLDAKPGIKLNKYPKIKVQVPEVAGLIAGAEVSLGNAAAPPPDQLDTNYFHGGVDPLTLTLHLAKQAAKGRHDVPAKLSYFYCVAASGYCAPGKTELTIPITVR
jgi:hypothetical protein